MNLLKGSEKVELGLSRVLWVQMKIYGHLPH